MRSNRQRGTAPHSGGLSDTGTAGDDPGNDTGNAPDNDLPPYAAGVDSAMGLSDKKKSDIRIGMEDGQASQGARHYRLTVKQFRTLEEKLRENVSWNYTNTCASWAAETVYAVTGGDVDADDTLGFETPRQLTKSIAKLEKDRPTSIRSPIGVPDDANIATSR